MSGCAVWLSDALVDCPTATHIERVAHDTLDNRSAPPAAGWTVSHLSEVGELHGLTVLVLTPGFGLGVTDQDLPL
jgi:hypothetical protein